MSAYSQPPTASRAPMDRVTAIQRSLRCFVCGIAAFIPLLGILPAIYALACHRSVRVGYGNQWNPAQAYLASGRILGWLGTLSSLCLLGAALMALLLQLFS